MNDIGHSTEATDDLPAALSARRKARIRALADGQAADRDSWIDRNVYFHQDEGRYMRFLVPKGLKVLEIGCGTGRLLAALAPARGVGLDLSENMVAVARCNHPHLEFIVGDIEDGKTFAKLNGPFDVIIMSDTMGSLDDCQATLKHLHALSAPQTRVVLSYYSKLWEPFLWLAERLGAKMPQEEQNWLSTRDLAALLDLADFETIKIEWRQLLPRRLLGLGTLVNRYLAPLPILRRACLRTYVVARPRRGQAVAHASTSVVIPCRNEKGNIEPAIRRLPRFCDDLEVIFVEGHSRDGTYEECLRVKAAYPDRDIKVLRQDGVGKANAVHLGMAAARGDFLMILDADLTVSPESLPKFYEALAEGRGDFVNGTRLVYPMERGAMRFLNFWANRSFALIFSWLLNQRFTDTLCGTKALTRLQYRRLVAGRDYFGDFDPFGDFDLIFGASKLNLKIVEVPIRYVDRRYGETQISRFRHGWMLLRMVVFAFRKLKAP